MSRSTIDSRQVTLRQFLEQIANSSSYAGTADAKQANTSELDNLLSAINEELKPLLRLSASSTPNLVVSVGAGVLTNSESSYQRSIPHVGSLLPSFTSGTITFPASSGGTITVSPGINGTLTVSSGNYIKVLIYLDASGNLNVLPGEQNAVEASATVSPAPSKTLPIGYVTLQNVAGTIQNIQQNKIYQFGTGAGGSGSGTGNANPTPAPGYKWLEYDLFDVNKTSSDSKVENTNYTNATYSVAKQIYQLSVDKSKTVSSNISTNLVINSAPSFTVQPGDIAFIPKYSRRLVGFGFGTSTIAYSDDFGSTWQTLGNSIFSTSGRSGVWSGSKFVAVGQGTNTIAYSSDGASWTGIGTSIFSVMGYSIAYNGSVFVAVGDGTANSLAYSYDGINWTGLGKSIFSIIGHSVIWNGSRFIAVGGGTNKVAYSNDGINWTALSSVTQLGSGNSIASNGNVTVIGGWSAGTYNMLYSLDGGLTYTPFTLASNADNNSIIYDGFKFIASFNLTSTLYYSTDGINWTSIAPGVTFGGTSFMNGALYDGENVYIMNHVPTCTILRSKDGYNFSALTNPFTNNMMGLASSPMFKDYNVTQSQTMVTINSEATAGQWRRISAVTSQTNFTLDSAFSVNVSNGKKVMIAQAVYTKDLVNFGSATERTRARDYYSGKILDCIIDYNDSITAGDDVPDKAGISKLMVSSSNSGFVTDSGIPASNLFTATYTRPKGADTIQKHTLYTNTTQERLFLTFFPDPYNPDVSSTCNLLNYSVSFYGDDSSINSGILEDAICFSDNSTTPHNCSVATSGGQTSVTLDWSFIPNLRNGESQVEVFVDGKRINKFISSVKTPTSTDLYFTEATDGSGLYKKITFSADLSVTPVEIKIVKRFGVIQDISSGLSARVGAMYDHIVGSAAQVAAGIATHTTLTDAITAASSGQNILVLNNVTITDSPTVNKKLMIIGKGNGSSITGNLTVTSAAAKSTFSDLRIDGNITFQASADKCFMTNCYQSASKTFSNDPSNVDNSFDIITE